MSKVCIKNHILSFVIIQLVLYVLILLSCHHKENTTQPTKIPSTQTISITRPSSEVVPLPEQPTTPMLPDNTPPPTYTPTTTLFPSLTPRPTSIVPQSIRRPILVKVSEAITGLPRVEIWLLEAGETIPFPILQNSKISYEYPRWSNDDEWITFSQRSATEVYGAQIGAIRPDGTDMHLVTQDVFNSPNLQFQWSADDHWIVFFDTVPGRGWVPWSVEFGTGKLTELLELEPFTYSDVIMEPSPNTNQAVIIGWKETPSLQIDMWLVSLDGEMHESISVPFEQWSGCAGISSIDWSPEGQYLLVQPYDENDYSPPFCLPRLWLYDLSQKTWREIAKPPEGRDGSFVPLFIDWSIDGRWVAWEGIDWALVYSAETWEVVRAIELEAGFTMMPIPWVQDKSGNSILTVKEHKWTNYPFSTFTLHGLSPNGTPQDDKVILIIEDEAVWIPEGFYSTPLEWQP